jgi:hypothetical protein
MHRLLPALLLIASCSTGDGFESNAYEIGPGSPISIDITRVQGYFSEMPTNVELSVDIENMSDADLTIDRIDVWAGRGSSAFSIDAITKRVNHLLSDGEDYSFELRTWGKQNRPLRPNESSTIIIEVRVVLTNGDSYRAAYSVPVESRGRI